MLYVAAGGAAAHFAVNVRSATSPVTVSDIDTGVISQPLFVATSVCDPSGT